jgi:predicted membrane-bound spermidine synthase
MYFNLRRLSIKSLFPFLLVFFSSAGAMALELIASRLVGRYLGSSIYTWSAVIAVILFGMSVGNFLGGKAADRYTATSFLPWLSLLAAVACCSTLGLCNFFGDAALLKNLQWPLRILLTVAAVFTLPAVFIGMFMPFAAKMHVESTSRIGLAIGSIYAWGAVGSILGTLATGFFLIPSLKVSQSLWLITFFFSPAYFYSSTKRDGVA